MRCPRCHHENRSNAKFCEECATALARACGKCGAELSSKAKFCPECAHPVAAVVETPFDSPRAYTPAHLSEKILASRAALEGERKQVTVLFCDIANSTPMAEKLGAENMHVLLNRFFEGALAQVHRYEGTINQFLGDGFMALFGAPVAHEDHARRAVLAALEVRDMLRSSFDNAPLTTGESISLRMGLNTGPVVVGSIGDNLRMDYTAVGDTTNLAARLQQNAQPGQILISESTARMVRSDAGIRALPPLMVKGKHAPISAFEVTALSSRRPSGAHGRTLSPFVGRERELMVLREALSDACAGQGQIVSVVGEPGVGKSRLLHELRGQSDFAEVVFVEGACQSFGQSVPYLPLQDVVRALCHLDAADNAQQIAEKIHHTLEALQLEAKDLDLRPYLLQMLGIKEGTQILAQINPESVRGRTLQTLVQMVVHQSRRAPVALVIEDLHWIDKLSEEFMQRLAETMVGARLLLLTTTRPGYTPPWPAKSYASQIALKVLGAQAARTIVEATARRMQIEDSDAQSILSKGEGNPFFLEELTLAWKERAGSAALPDTVHGVIAARIDRLPEDAKRALQTAAVLGREFPLRLLEAVAEHANDLTHSLSLLRQAEFLFERQGSQGPEYVFKHALTQDVAYESLLTGRRQALHDAAGLALERFFPAQLESHCERIAHHFVRSGNSAKALDYLEMANAKAIKANSLPDAQSFFEQAYALLQTLPDEISTRRRRVELLFAQLVVYVYQLNVGGYEKMLLDTVPQAASLNDARLYGRLLACISHCQWFFVRSDDSLATAHRAVALCYQAGDNEGLAQVYSTLQWTHYNKAEFEKVVEYEPLVLASLERAQHPKALLWCMSATICAQSETGQYELIERRATRIIEEGERVGDADLVCQALWSWAYARIKQRRLDEAIEMCTRAIEIAPTIGGKAWASITLAWALVEMDPPRAISLLEPLVDIFRTTSPLSFGWVGFVLGEALMHAGRLDDAEAILEEVRTRGLNLYMPHHVAYSYLLLGEVALRRETLDVAKAGNHFIQASHWAEQCRMRVVHAISLEGHGKLFARTGRADEARAKFQSANELHFALGTVGAQERLADLIERLPS